jgi:two-component system, NtrC family, sensor kinase
VTANTKSVAIEIEDSGPGPDPATAEHLFDPFYSGRDAGRGRGFGLATAWRFARENGGSLRYERVANGPTRFVMTLPAAEQAINDQRDVA